ncbi:MAG: lipoate--protein ligase family protein [Burkholderiales bacterium]
MADRLSESVEFETPRLLDTGLRPAAQNVALSRALLEARAAAEIPDTLRFLRSSPAALLDGGQSAAQEFDVEACRAAGFSLQRRITRGPALAIAEGDLGWELCLHRQRLGVDPETAARRLCNAAAAALAALGIGARHRAHNEIAVDGRRLAVTALAGDGAALLFQGVVQVEADHGYWCALLRPPAAAPDEGVLAAARERVTSLAALLGRAPVLPQVRANLTEAFEAELATEFAEGELTLSEHERYRRALAEMSTDGWVRFATAARERAPYAAGTVRHAGGVLRAALLHDLDGGLLKRVWFSGDAPVRSRVALLDLEAALAGTPLARLERVVEEFFARHADALRGLRAADVTAAVRAATQPVLIAR